MILTGPGGMKHERARRYDKKVKMGLFVRGESEGYNGNATRSASQLSAHQTTATTTIAGTSHPHIGDPCSSHP